MNRYHESIRYYYSLLILYDSVLKLKFIQYQNKNINIYLNYIFLILIANISYENKKNAIYRYQQDRMNQFSLNTKVIYILRKNKIQYYTLYIFFI